MGRGKLDRLVAGIVDDVGVVAGAALHHVRAGAAVEHIGGLVADNTLASALPVPSIASRPVSVRFST